MSSCKKFLYVASEGGFKKTLFFLIIITSITQTDVRINHIIIKSIINACM